MEILIVNMMLSSSEKCVITRRKSNKDSMIYNFARGLVANGHSVTVCASEEYMPLEKEQNEFEVIYFKSKWRWLFKPYLIPFPLGLRSFVKENINKYDLVIASEIFQMATLLIADICKDKLVVWQELSLHNQKLFKLPSKFWYNFVVSCTSLKNALVIPRSENAKAFIKQYSCNVSDDIVEHGANGEVLIPKEYAGRNFSVVGQLIARKNVDSIVRKFASFVKKEGYSDFVLNIIGEGAERESLERLTEELAIQENVIFRGFLTHQEMAGYLSDSYALLVDTLRDLNMVSIPESIVSGTPVLMNTVPCTAQFVSENGLGIAKENWNEQDIEEMVKNYELFHSNCVKIREQLTNVGCAKKMIDIFIKNKKAN
ncbi:MAG: glycosyltransferase family 4 protein [Bacteroidales bacterium]|nr:glycosyltransferase family 4 protein [Bacteroidales bacterium]